MPTLGSEADIASPCNLPTPKRKYDAEGGSPDYGIREPIRLKQYRQKEIECDD